MRYIDLRRKGSLFKSILKYGYGPNFVLKRKEAFAQMIKEQGEVFWFRFWLSFCFQPAYDPLEVSQKNYRIIQHLWYENLHDNILQVPAETAAMFYLDVAVSSLLRTKNQEEIDLQNPPSTEELYREIDQLVTDLCLEEYQKVYMTLPNSYFSMAFGVALCEVFCKWLNAADTYDERTNYWVIPSAYLNARFIPEHLEMFMACKWQDELFMLLDVSKAQVPWLTKLLGKMQALDYTFDYKGQIRAIRTKNTDVEQRIMRSTANCVKIMMENLKEEIEKKEEERRRPVELKETRLKTWMKKYVVGKFHPTNTSTTTNNLPKQETNTTKKPERSSELATTSNEEESTTTTYLY